MNYIEKRQNILAQSVLGLFQAGNLCYAGSLEKGRFFAYNKKG